MPRYEELYLKTGQVITEDWYANLVDILEQITEGGAITYGGVVKSDLIPETDLMMKLGDAGQRFLSLFAGYGYFSFEVKVGDSIVIKPDKIVFPDGTEQGTSGTVALEDHDKPSGAHGVEAPYYIAKTSRSDQLPSWDDIPDKPSEFPPEAHTHDASDITSGVLDEARIPHTFNNMLTVPELQLSNNNLRDSAGNLRVKLGWPVEILATLKTYWGGGFTNAGQGVTKYWKVGELPYSDLSTFQKLFIWVWGGGNGAWVWRFSGIDMYVVATRDKNVVYRTRVIGETGNYSIKIFDDGEKYIVCVALENQNYPNILIRAWKLDYPDYWIEQEIEDVTDQVGNWTDVTSQFEFVDSMLTDRDGNVSFENDAIIKGNLRIYNARDKPILFNVFGNDLWLLRATDSVIGFKAYVNGEWVYRYEITNNTGANSRQHEWYNTANDLIMYVDYEGDLYASSYNTISRRELKFDIRPADIDFLKLISELKIYKYRLKADPETERIGLIADEVPELLQTRNEKGEVVGYDLNKLVTLLLGAIQQLQDEVIMLKKQMSELQAKLAKLEEVGKSEAA